MCGILLTTAENSEIQNESCLHNRGPDLSSSCTIDISGDNIISTQTYDDGDTMFNRLYLYFYGWVLHIRGSGMPTSQPLISVDGEVVLLWNGEIFDGFEEIGAEENDGNFLLNQICEASKESENTVLSVLTKIQGPYAFILYLKRYNKCFFARDIFGRRSLLIGINKSSPNLIPNDKHLLPLFYLSSVRLNNPEFNNIAWTEIPAIGIFSFHFNLTSMTTLPILCSLNVWDFASKDMDLSYITSVFNGLLANSNVSLSETVLQSIISPFNYHLPDINDNLSSLMVSDEDLLLIKDKNNYVNLFDDVILRAVSHRVRLVPQFCANCHATYNVRNNEKTQLPDSSKNKCQHSKIAVLFSGGLDSTVLAAYVDRCLPNAQSIDLLNVAFERQALPNSAIAIAKKKSKKTKTAAVRNNQKITTAHELQDAELLPMSCANQDMNFGANVNNCCTLLANDVDNRFLVPDRLSALQGLQELTKLNLQRTWNFVEINVSIEELKTQRECRIRHLIHPLETVLDDSIGCALWFAARGRGILHAVKGGSVLKHENYQCNAKVLIVGMGADEQLGGYSRHQTIYRNEGFAGLCHELHGDVKRISSRNLGRDDRIISDHGKEARFPFLDEQIVSFLNSLPINVKTMPSLPKGVGDKILLRRLARQCFGLMRTALEPKRAIQFGSRIAKTECSKESGHEVCHRLNAVV